MTKRTGVDEFKLIGLLWRDSPASPRKGISTHSITALAVDLADREGLDAVTIRRLAEDAGVTAMALYPHIGGRAELVELMLDLVAGRVPVLVVTGSAVLAARVSRPAVAVLVAVWLAGTGLSPSVAGLHAGRRFGALLGPRLDLIGGVVLIGLGVKILLEHLTGAA